MSNVDGSRNRFVAWSALFVFSAVALTAHQTDDTARDNNGLSSTEDKWVTSVTAISMAFGFLAVVACFVMRDRFISTPIELGLALILIILWAGGLPVIMNPNNNLANTENQDGKFVIDNTNLYFSSWGAFIANMYILASFARSEGLADASRAPPKTPMWAMLFAASFVVMVSSARFFDTNCDDGSSTCTRTKYAISLGVVSVLISMIMCFLSARYMAPLLVEFVISLLLLMMYTCGVGFITFKTGPGTTIGNLYFSTWGGFVCTLALTAMGARDMFSGDDGGVASEQAPDVDPNVEEVPKV